MEGKVLFVLATTGISTGLMGSSSSVERLIRLRKCGFEQYYDVEFVDKYIREHKNKEIFGFSWKTGNLVGQWIASSITTESKILDEPISLETLRNELNNDDYTHVVFCTALDGYSLAAKSARVLKQEFSNLTTICVLEGALVSESKKDFDHVFRGNYVLKMRRLLKEPFKRPYTVPMTTAKTTSRFMGIEKNAVYGIMFTSEGCPNACDFCQVSLLHGSKYKCLFTKNQIMDGIEHLCSIVEEKRKEINLRDDSEIVISLAEPIGLYDINMWLEIFNEFKYDIEVSLCVPTSAQVMERYVRNGLEKLTRGSLHLRSVNIGVESMVRPYPKNKGTNLKTLSRNLQRNGISAHFSLILGFDWHDRKTVWTDVEKMVDLEATGYIVQSLEIYPGTRIYRQLAEQGRMLRVPPEFLALQGYLAFKHPKFKSGFNDMLPLLDEVSELIDNRNNPQILNELSVFLNRPNIVNERLKHLTGLCSR